MIKYITGDVTDPLINSENEIAVVVHLCNNLGAYNAGVAKAIRNKWPRAYEAYSDELAKKLGTYTRVQVETNVQVVNLIGMEGIGRDTKPIRYIPIKEGLHTLGDKLRDLNRHYDFATQFLPDPNVISYLPHYTVHLPKIGTGLAGGDWETIEAILEEELSGLNVFVYELPTLK